MAGHAVFKGIQKKDCEMRFLASKVKIIDMPAEQSEVTPTQRTN